MIVDINGWGPLALILGAALGAAGAPTVATIWAENRANKNAMRAAEKASEVKHALQTTSDLTNHKLDVIHVLVNNQLSQAVERLNVATTEIESLKRLVTELSTRQVTA